MKKTLLLSFTLLITFLVQASTYNMRALGADATGKKSCTKLINETIKKAAKDGGGTLYFPAGTYLTAAIHLESNITIDIESGATLLFSDKFEEYLPFVKIRWEGVFMNSLSPLFYAANKENITIKGRGKIDGNGFNWWKESRRIISEIRANGNTLETNELQQMWLDANKDVSVSPYYENTMKRKFFRPPFIQFFECNNIHIEDITIVNSPFWTINPVGCNDLVIDGVTIYNPSKNPKGHNTDGINPESCSNVRISNCFISVGDDCITIKSGRDQDGRDYGKPCENLTITNCVMLAGHGGVVIGSEMSGGVKKVTISNCVFDGTDAGIRLKASRGRGGVVEEIRVNNIVMNNIQKNAFIFNLFYDKDSKEEPVSERTPVFRNIHISNVTGSNVQQVGFLLGISEMPVSEISFSNINMTAQKGFTAETGKNIQFHNVDLSVKEGASFAFKNCEDVVLDNVRAKAPLPNQSIVELDHVNNVLVNNCFQLTPADIFITTTNSNVIWGNNFFSNVKKPVIANTRILTIGDSTMANYDEEQYSGEKEQRGWGQLFPRLVTGTTVVTNAAKNGRSSKSFYYEFWNELKETVQRGDYVFIQFGHNDEKSDGLDSDENDKTQRGTAAWGQYQKYLTKYVEDVRAKGANPVFFTPVVRRAFNKNNISINDKGLHNLSSICGNDSTMNYPLAMRVLAEKLSVPVVDMTKLTRELVEAYGPKKSKEVIYVNVDDTHLKEQGALLFAKLAVADLQKQGILTTNLKK